MSADGGSLRGVDAAQRRRGSFQQGPATSAPPAPVSGAARRRPSVSTANGAAQDARPHPQAQLQRNGGPRGSAKPKPRGASQPSDDTLQLAVTIVGVKFPCRVLRHWPCEALVSAAIAEYQRLFPGVEAPDCNLVFHRGKQAYLIASETIGSCCVAGDEIELGIDRAPPSSISSEADDTASLADRPLPPFEFSISFHRLPLGFTMKQSYEHIVVANIYPKSAAIHYRRLLSGVVVVEIAGTPLADLGLRHVHGVMKEATLPLSIRFRGHLPPAEVVLPTSVAGHPGSAPLGFSDPNFPSTAPGSTPSSPRSTSSGKQRRRSRTNSGGRRANGRSRKGSTATDHDADNQHDLSAKAQGAKSAETGSRQQYQPQPSPAETATPDPRPIANGGDASEHPPLSAATAFPTASNQSDGESEEALVESMRRLQVALVKKHEEAKQIARQIELCHEKLMALRAAAPQPSPTPSQTSVAPPPAPVSVSHARATPSTPRTQSTSSLRLTPEVLEAMDQKAGLPAKGSGYYTSSNISSVSGYSNSSHRTRQQRSVRYSGSNADNASVSSHTSGVERRGSYPSKSPRNAAMQNLNKRYNYMPQKYAAAHDDHSSTLSTRGAVMSRAKITRDSFITKSESPGVGYYDVKLPERVKGGEIGDADRSLPWS